MFKNVAIDPTCINTRKPERMEPNLVFKLNGRWLQRTEPNEVAIRSSVLSVVYKMY